MHSDEGLFWDQRYSREGAIWGEAPSPTARLAVRFLPPNARVLEVGFGYGRDLAFLVRHPCEVWGIDLSVEGYRLAGFRLRDQGLTAQQLVTGSFENSSWPDELFDAVISHRLVHLLVTDQAVECFAGKVRRVLRPGGILCLGARNSDDLNQAEMRRVADGVYEYLDRPGHRIRYWDDEDFRRAFGKAFTFLAFDQVCENESTNRPVPCHLTVMVGSKIDGVKHDVHTALPRPHQIGDGQLRGNGGGTQP